MGKRIKNKVVSFRVTPEVSDQIHSKADAAGESLAAFLTDAALGKEIINLNELTAFTKELKRHGTNLNQLAVLAHTGKIQCPDIGEALRLYEQLLGLLKKKTERRPD